VDTVRPLPASVRVDSARWRMPRMIWMQAVVPKALCAGRVDVAHFTNGMMPLASTVPTVVTIHDMSLTLFPGCHPPRRVWLNRPMVDLAARRATRIITVSESAKQDIVDLYGIPPSRVHVVHEAADPSFRRVDDERELARVRARYGLADRFMLYVGTIEPRKNLPTLLDAFARRRRSGDLPHQLALAGPYGWLSRDIGKLIERLQIESAVVFTGYVPYQDLPALYSAAELFVFPSLYEGFGLPVVEAMACGTPVVAGRVAALVEVAGGAAEHVDPLDADALGDLLVVLSRDPARRDELAVLGLRRAQAFSWERAARETLGVYRQAAVDEARTHGPEPALHPRVSP
jgi:glycosyltransferase involved in cell wall biosynthesis